MNRVASVIVSATVAAAMATLATPAQAQQTTPPATTPPKATPAAPAPKAAPAPAAPKAAAPAPAPKAAAPAPAPKAAAHADASAAAAAAPAAAVVAAPAPAAEHAPPPATEHAPAPAAAAPTTAGTTVVVMTNPSVPQPQYPLCPPPRQLAPLFAPAAFLVRFGAGPGYTWGSGDPNTSLTGASGGFDLTMGGFVLQDFALTADFGWIDVFDPDFTVDGTVLDSTSVMFQASTFRAGASYYFMPVRMYASLSAGFAVAALTSYSYSDDTENNVTLVGREYTKIGPSFAAEIGKEFEVSPYWGIGLAAHYELLSVPPGDDHSKATIDLAQQISLRFIATFGDR